MSAASTFKGAVDQATDNRGLEILARVGYPVNGVLHLLIAYIIVGIALGARGEADQTGALATLAAQRGGRIALWVVAFGLIALALWRLAETLLGLHPGECTDAHHRDTPIINRLKAFGLAAVYTAIAITAIQFALGGSRKGSQEAAGLSARLMQSDGGRAVLVIIGLIVTAIGAYFAYKGASRNFLNDLNAPCGPAVTFLGFCGHVAEGSVLAAAGLSMIVATYRSDPAQATGLDGAVKTLGQSALGPVVLAAAAAGFAAYGLYCFVLARYARM